MGGRLAADMDRRQRIDGVAHGGELDVTSMVGVGTSFVVRLPLR